MLATVHPVPAALAPTEAGITPAAAHAVARAEGADRLLAQRPRAARVAPAHALVPSAESERAVDSLRTELIGGGRRASITPRALVVPQRRPPASVRHRRRCPVRLPVDPIEREALRPRPKAIPWGSRLEGQRRHHPALAVGRPERVRGAAVGQRSIEVGGRRALVRQRPLLRRTEPRAVAEPAVLVTLARTEGVPTRCLLPCVRSVARPRAACLAEPAGPSRSATALSQPRVVDPVPVALAAARAYRRLIR